MGRTGTRRWPRDPDDGAHGALRVSGERPRPAHLAGGQFAGREPPAPGLDRRPCRRHRRDHQPDGGAVHRTTGSSAPGPRLARRTRPDGGRQRRSGAERNRPHCRHLGRGPRHHRCGDRRNTLPRRHRGPARGPGATGRDQRPRRRHGGSLAGRCRTTGRLDAGPGGTRPRSGASERSCGRGNCINDQQHRPPTAAVPVSCC